MRRFTFLLAAAALATCFAQTSFALDRHFHTNDTPSGYGYGFPSFASPFNPLPLDERSQTFGIGW